MKKNSQSLMSKYSDGSIKRKKTSGKDYPLMTTYEQRYKGGNSKEVTFEKTLTLDEKIEKREKLLHPEEPANTNNDLTPHRVSVEIAGVRYLMGCTSEMSEARIRRVASTVNSILSDAIDDNPGLTNSRVTTLALLDACDKLVAAQDELSNMKTELMYLQQKVNIEKSNHVPSEPTPMEQLAMGTDINTETK